jgi:hypothetical protein
LAANTIKQLTSSSRDLKLVSLYLCSRQLLAEMLNALDWHLQIAQSVGSALASLQSLPKLALLESAA